MIKLSIWLLSTLIAGASLKQNKQQMQNRISSPVGGMRMTFKLPRAIHALIITAVIAVSGGQSVMAEAILPSQDIKGSKDSSLVKRYEGSFIIGYEAFSFTDFTVPLGPLKVNQDKARDHRHTLIFTPEKKLDVEGRLTRLVYLTPENRSPLEVLRNYEDEITAATGEILFKCKAEECGGDATRASDDGGGEMSLMMQFFRKADLKDEFASNGYCALASKIRDQRFLAGKIPGSEGDTYVTVQTFTLLDSLYCKAFNGRTIALVHILEPKGREKKMVTVSAADMANSLNTGGKIALYGIYFDTDKADVKPESAPTLKEIAQLLKSGPGLNVVVVGHTDSQGKYSYNMDLSARRAAAVKAALVATYDVKPERLQTAGDGMTAPVASNDTEEGRAKNRRVELVKMN